MLEYLKLRTMKIIINSLICITCILYGNSSFSQITKCRTTTTTFKSKDEYTNKWSKWDEWKETNILITFDISSDRIKVFSKEEHVYDIIKYYPKSIDNDGDETLKFHCVDEEGIKCFVRLVKLNSQDGRNQLYIDFANIAIAYNIYTLD